MKREIIESDFGESYVKAVLRSGLKIYILEKPQYNSCYAIFGTKYGSIDTCFSVNGEETSVPEGIAHFLEHKLFESEDGDAFTKYAETGAYANAFTSFDRTCYLFSCSDKFYDNLKILLSFVQSPYFTEQTVKKEQGIIGQEIRMYDDSPGWRVMFNMLMAMYHNHPVRIDIAGTVESIAQIDHNLLYKCYNTFYNPANMFICIAGNVDTEQVLKQIKESINPVEPVEITRIGSEEPEEIVKPLVEQSLEVAQPMFCFGYKQAISKPECTVKDKICTALLLEIIAGDASPLYKELTDEGLINDEFSTEHFCGHGYSAFIFEGESKNPKLVAEKIRNEIERLKIEGIDKKLFSAIRCGMYGNAIRLFDSVEGIAMQMVDCAMLDSGLFDDVKYLKSVTADDVYKRLLKFEQDKAVLSVINPVEEV
ncbi:MAG: insulinase family protein [Ruminococcaceae bacterium]|nr:insulinase family protein [Oscillospiraceae bacterium]